MEGAGARGPTRRQLLLGVGAAGGGGAVLAAMAALDLVGDDRAAPFSPPGPSDRTRQGRGAAGRVVVLGAGVAGLCCAFELQKAGYEVTVLEARDRVGGRSLTVRAGTRGEDTRGAVQTATFREGRFFDAGPGRIAQHHVTLDYCRELGVPVEVFVNENPDAFVESRGVVRRRRSVQADLDGYVSELLTKALDASALDAEVTASEREGLVAYLADAGVLGTSRRGYVEPPGADGGEGEVGPPDDLATLLQLGTGPRLAFERGWDMAMPMFHVVGGMDRLVAAMADALRRPVRTGVTVTEVRGSVDAVVVLGTDRAGAPVRVEADHGVCTLPPQLAAGLRSTWDGEVVRALGLPRAFPTGKIGLEYDRRFWELDDRILGGISTTSREPRAIWYPSDDILGAGGVVTGAYPFGQAALRFGRLRHEAREQTAVEAGVALHGPVYRDSLRSSFSVDWSSQPSSDGGWSTWERHGSYYQRLLQPEGRWWFAGDWLSRSTGWQHGALLSARRVVDGLHAAALAGGDAVTR